MTEADFHIYIQEKSEESNEEVSSMLVTFCSYFEGLTFSRDSCIKRIYVKNSAVNLYQLLMMSMPYASVSDKMKFQQNIDKAFKIFETELGL